MDYSTSNIPVPIFIIIFCLFFGGGLILFFQYRFIVKNFCRTLVPKWIWPGENKLAALPFIILFCFCVGGVDFIINVFFTPNSASFDSLLCYLFLRQFLGLSILCLCKKYIPESFPQQIDYHNKEMKSVFSVFNLFSIYAFIFVLYFIITVGGLLNNLLITIFPFLTEAFDQKQMIVQVLIDAKATGSMKIYLMLPIVSIMTPILEELIFRAGLYRFLKGKASLIPAILLTSIIFAILHDSPATYIPLTLFSIVMCYAYEKTGRLIVPIILHGIFNGVTFLTMIYFT